VTRRLEGKVAIVTGASKNIGGSIAAGFAVEGAKVVCNDLDPATAAATAERVAGLGGHAMALPGDVTDEAYVAAAVERTIDEWGRIDVLVNNAVLFNKKGVLDMSHAEFRAQLDVILGGAFLLTKHVAAAMIELGIGGSIVNVLSTAAWQGEPGNIGYSTGKGALINFTRSAAMELAQHGIRVNGFTPTATAITDAAHEARRAESRSSGWTMEFESHLPLGRRPTPEDYVPALVFLASDDSRMMTGTNITVDAGATAKYWPWVPHPD